MQTRFLQSFMNQASSLFAPAASAAKTVSQSAPLEHRCMHILAKHVNLDYLEKIFSKQVEKAIYPRAGQQLSKTGLLTLTAYSNSVLYSKIKTLHELGGNLMNPKVHEEMTLLEEMALKTLEAMQPEATHSVSRNLVMSRAQIEEVRRNMQLELRPVTSVSCTDTPFYTGGNIDLKIYTPHGVIPAESLSDYNNEKLGLLPPHGHLKVLHFEPGHSRDRIRSTPLPDDEYPKFTLVCEHQLDLNHH